MKNKRTYILLLLFLGVLGGHCFYVKHYYRGIVYLWGISVLSYVALLTTKDVNYATYFICVGLGLCIELINTLRLSDEKWNILYN